MTKINTFDLIGLSVTLNPEMGYTKWWCSFKYIITSTIHDNTGPQNIIVQARMAKVPHTKKQKQMEVLSKPFNHFKIGNEN